MVHSSTGKLLHAAAVILLGALVWASAARPLGHDDLFWHMRTGELIARTGSVPTSDPFSFTLPGAPWTSHEWGFALIVHAIERAFGLGALVVLTQVLGVLLFGVLYALLRRLLAPERRALAVPLLLLGLLASHRALFITRAALFTSLFLAALSYLLLSLHERPRLRHEIAIAALFLLWANLHAGVVFGIAVLGLFAVQTALDAWREQRERDFRALVRGRAGRRALLLAACSALTLITPNGIDLWLFPLETHKTMYESGLRWRLGHFAAPTLHEYPGFYAMISLCLAACLPLRRLRALVLEARVPGLFQGLCALLFLALALRSSRFAPDFAIFALPFCALRWGGAVPAADPAAQPHGRAFPGRLGPRAAAAGHALGVVLIVVAALLLRPSAPRATVSDHLPKRAVEFIRREQIDGRMFHPMGFAGYIGWQLGIQVFWDGRTDVFLPIAKQLAYAKSFGELVARHDLQVLMLERIYYARFRSYLEAHTDTWGLVYFDEIAALYVRRAPAYQRLLERWEYRLLRPFGVPSDAELQRVARNPELAQRAEREAARAIAQNPSTFAPWYIRGALAESRGDARAAYEHFARAVALSPDARALYRQSRVALALGRDDEAKRLVTRALAQAGP